ncbi:MAG: hypothetical protein K1W26_05780 [Acetatifactor sp.]
MTAYEIYEEIGTGSQPEYYDMGMLMEDDIEGASKLIQEYFKCDKETADEAIAIMNNAVDELVRRRGIIPLTTEQRIAYANAAAREALNKPKCPTCSSTNLKEISITSKIADTAMYGIFGTKRNKTFHCNNCGYEW